MMNRFLKILLCLSLVSSLAFLSSACGSACNDLAKRVCSCQPTREKETSCRISISAAKENSEPSNSQENKCESILKSGDCTCAALAAGDLSACGLAEDAQVVFD